MRSRLLMTHPEGEFTPLADPRQHCLVVEAKFMRTWEKTKIYKTRLSGSKVSVSSTTFMYPSMYFTM